MANENKKLWAVLKARIEAIADSAQLQAEGAPYVVYAFLDLAHPDVSGQFPGTPLYVGETKTPFIRVHDHFWTGIVGGGGSGSIHEEIGRLARLGSLPVVQIIQRCETRSASRYCETQWAQGILRDGHRLFNRRKDQSTLATPALQIEKARPARHRWRSRRHDFFTW